MPVDETRRFKGPAFDAVIGSVETFATDGFVDEVYVVPHGAKMRGEPVLRVTNATIISPRWIDADSLLIRTSPNGRVFLEKHAIVVGGRPVDIHFAY